MEKTEEKQKIEFDLVLDKIGHMGRFQILLCLMLSYLGIQACLHAVSPVFYAGKTPHRCRVGWIDDVDDDVINKMNLTDERILMMTTPISKEDPGEYDRCMRFEGNASMCSGGGCGGDDGMKTSTCDDGYVYDTSQFTSTVVTEWDLVCDRAIFNSHVTSVFMGGMWFGAIVSGYLLDYIGRRYTILLMSILSLVVGVAISFNRNFIFFVFLRFLSAATSHGAFLSAFVYVVEVTGKHRTASGAHVHTGFSVGYMVNSLIAYFFRDWRQYYFVLSLTPLPYFLFHFFIPESPRWHFSNDRVSAGINVSNRFAKINGVKLTSHDYESCFVAQKKDKVSKKNHTCLDLFKPRRMRWVTMNMMFSWMVISMVYYGLSLNAGSLAGDIYLNNSLNGLLEVVGYFLVQFTMDRFGRRAIMVWFFFIQGCACLASAGLRELAVYLTDAASPLGYSLLTLSTILAFVGKVFNAGSFAAVYNFTAELFPTVIRGNALGAGSMAARVGSICSPYIIFLQNRHSWLPATIFGVFGVMGGAASLAYPETMNRYMPQTVAEAEMFYRGEDFSGNNEAKFVSVKRAEEKL